jgi:hypothetical protein
VKNALSLAIVLLLGATASAELDFSVVSARVEAGVAASADGPKKVRAAYLDLQRRLAKPDRPGLVDDFGKLRGVSVKLAGPLSADVDLATATEALLGVGGDSLAEESQALLAIVIELESVHDQSRCQAARDKGIALASRVTPAVFKGRRAAAAKLGARSAETYEKGLALATKLLERQNVRATAWSVPLRDLGGSLLSVWAEPGPSPTVYAVGADDGDGPQFLRMAPEGWIRVPVAESGNLWWVNGVPAGEDAWKIYASGTGGRVVSYDPATGGMEDLSTGVTAILYGVWGSSTSDVWAVGGNEDGTQPRSALLHHDGDHWTNVPLPEGANNRQLFKVWGLAADDVWACGQAGLVMHFDGTQWSVVPVAGATQYESYFTAHGVNPTIVVGGSVMPALEEGGLAGFASVSTPPGIETLRGVHVEPSGDAWACGLIGTVLRRTGGLWSRVGGLPTTPADPARDFHAVFVDDAGGAYFVGGDLVLNKKGCLFYYGPRAIPSLVLPQAKLSGRVGSIFASRTCATSGCHVESAPSAGLDLYVGEFPDVDLGLLRSRIVGVKSTQAPNLSRIEPGRPSKSYLWHKIANTQRSVAGAAGGDQMPQGGPFLGDADMDAVRAWILEGAKDN